MMDAYEFMNEADFNWLILAARDNKGDRPWMECVHVKGGMAYTTDGHRVHAAPAALEDGVYDVFVDGLDAYSLELLTREQSNTPESLGMDARLDEWRDQICTGGKVTTLGSMINKGGFFGAAITKDGVARINRNYLIQGLFGMTDGEKTSIKYGLINSNDNAVYSTDGAREFLIIGLRDGAIDLSTAEFNADVDTDEVLRLTPNTSGT